MIRYACALDICSSWAMSSAVKKRGLSIGTPHGRVCRRVFTSAQATDRAAFAFGLPLRVLEEARRCLCDAPAVERLVDPREHLGSNQVAIREYILGQILDDLRRRPLAVFDLADVDDEVG